MKPADLAVTHHFVQLPQLRMHYVEAGKGETVLFLHGFPEFWYSWRHQLAALAPHYRVVAPDLRGYNETESRGPSHWVQQEEPEKVNHLLQTHLARASANA